MKSNEDVCFRVRWGLLDKQAPREALEPRAAWGPGAWPCTAKGLVRLYFSCACQTGNQSQRAALNVFMSRVQLVPGERKEILDAPETGFVKTAQKRQENRMFILNRSVRPMKGSPGPPGPKGQEGAPGPKVSQKRGHPARFPLSSSLNYVFPRASEGWRETSGLLV